MARLQDLSWLTAYAVGSGPTCLRIKRSFDQMRTWQFVGEVQEAARDLDNANLWVAPDGTVRLAMRSLVSGESYRINVYSSGDAGNSFQYLSTPDANEMPRGSQTAGVWEPFLIGLPDGRLACFYANEKHSIERPAFSQIIAERVSSDGGETWGPEIAVVAQPGVSRPGEPNAVAINGGLALFYEVCGSENCVGHTSWSFDSVSGMGASGNRSPRHSRMRRPGQRHRNPDCDFERTRGAAKRRR